MGAKITFGGKDSVGPIVDALNRRFEKMETKLGDVAKQSKVTQREAEAIWRKAQSPLDRYNDTLRKGRGLLDGSAEGQRKYSQVVAMANRSLKDQRKFFGSTAVSQLSSYAAGWVSVSTAVGLLTSAFRQMDAARQKAAEGLKSDLPSLSELAQLAGGDPRKLASLQEQARRTFRSGASETLGGAGRLLFALKSAGVSQDQIPFFQSLARSQAFGDVAGLARSTAALRTSLGGEAGTNRELISQALGASQFAPSSVDDLLRASARGGPSARTLGVSPAGLLAMTAAGATATGTAEQGATLTQAFLRSLEKQGGFEGLGAIGSIQEVQRRVSGGTDIRELLGGRQEAISGFRIFQNNLPTITQSIAASRQAVTTNLASRTAELALQSRGAPAALAARQSAAGLTVSRERFGASKLREQIAIDDAKARLDQSTHPFARLFGDFVAERGGAFLGALGVFNSSQDEPSVQELRAIREATERTAGSQGDLQTVEN